MTKSEIRKLIVTKKNEADILLKRSEDSNDLSEVRSIGEILTKLRDEINELEEKMSNEVVNDDSITDDQRSRNLVNGDIIKARSNDNNFDENGFRTVATFGSSGTSVFNSDNYALRSNESMVSRIKSVNKNLNLGKYVRGVITGNWDGAVEERSELITTANGIAIPQVLSAQVIDKARNLSLFSEAGVPIVPMDSDNLKIARVVKDPEFAFKEIGSDGANGNAFEMDTVELKSHTAYGYAYVPMETIMSAKNLTQVLTEAFSGAIAEIIDKGMLYGQYNGASYDTFAPSGIMNNSDINVITATNVGYSDYVRAVGAVRRANGVPTILGINADTEEIISLLVDDNGQPLNAPKVVEQLKTIVSNQLVCDDTAGSDALVFDPNAMVIGIQNNIRFRIITDSDECIKKNLVAFQISAMLDNVVVRPKHIAKIVGVKETSVVSV